MFVKRHYAAIFLGRMSSVALTQRKTCVRPLVELHLLSNYEFSEECFLICAHSFALSRSLCLRLTRRRLAWLTVCRSAWSFSSLVSQGQWVNSAGVELQNFVSVVRSCQDEILFLYHFRLQWSLGCHLTFIIIFLKLCAGRRQKLDRFRGLSFVFDFVREISSRVLRVTLQMRRLHPFIC